MIELNKINPGTAKVTVARPLGRAMSNAGGREVEAVTPVVLDNDAALGFLRERARQQATGQRENSASEGKESASKHARNDSRRDLVPRHEARAQRHFADQQTARPLSLDASASTGFVTHLMGQNESETGPLPGQAQKRVLLERFHQSSEAYRKAGAEPIYFGESSQMVRVAV